MKCSQVAIGKSVEDFSCRLEQPKSRGEGRDMQTLSGKSET
jgi:hypothetical protein